MSGNERGSALLIVLMLVVIFTVLGLGLLTMNISASKQFSKKEEQVQARHMAEMGLLHYKKEINNEVMSYSFTRKKDETEEAAIIRSKGELCNKILAVSPPLLMENIKPKRLLVKASSGDEFSH